MKKIYFSFSLVCVSSALFGQSSFNTSGGSVANNSGSISISVGQVVCSSVSNSSGSVSQGVQQTYEISVLGMTENKYDLSLNAYPNPTSDQLHLKVNNTKNEKLTYRIVDLSGKEVDKSLIVSEETVIDMKNLSVSTYILEVYSETAKIQSFKICKNN